MLLEYFDSVTIISLDDKTDRRDRLVNQMFDLGLIKSKDEVIIQYAIPGDKLSPSSWWKEGGGAWGCMHSHVRFLQDAWVRGDKTALVLEDDAIWQDDAVQMLDDFMTQVPEDWGQIYLGGQHTKDPSYTDSPEVFKAGSINRTHCYAVNRKSIPKIHAHITYFPDYVAGRARGNNHHVDHQMEVAHRRGDWNVYCPTWWIVGQGENHSDINGRHHPNKWWHPTFDGLYKEIPIILVDLEDREEARKNPHLHFGWDFDKDGDLESLVEAEKHPGLLRKAISQIHREAYEMQRLPAFCFLGEAQEEKAKRISAGNFKGYQEEKDRLSELSMYPRNGIFEHPWIKNTYV